MIKGGTGSLFDTFCIRAVKKSPSFSNEGDFFQEICAAAFSDASTDRGRPSLFSSCSG